MACVGQVATPDPFRSQSCTRPVETGRGNWLGRDMRQFTGYMGIYGLLESRGTAKQSIINDSRLETCLCHRATLGVETWKVGQNLDGLGKQVTRSGALVLWCSGVLVPLVLCVLGCRCSPFRCSCHWTVVSTCESSLQAIDCRSGPLELWLETL